MSMPGIEVERGQARHVRQPELPGVGIVGYWCVTS